MVDERPAGGLRDADPLEVVRPGVRPDLLRQDRRVVELSLIHI